MRNKNEWKIFHKTPDSNFFQRLKWRLQFNKVNIKFPRGRCIDCDAINHENATECLKFYCPCDDEQHLKHKKIKTNNKIKFFDFNFFEFINKPNITVST